MRFNDSEWRVMGVLWERSPQPVRDVTEALESETGWAYSTVKTLLARLVEKGAVEVEKRGNVSFFTPLATRESAQRSAVRTLLDRAFGGAADGLVHHLVDGRQLSKKERDVLRRALDEADS